MPNNERPVSPINGQPLPVGKPFVAGDSRAREAQKESAKARSENTNFMKLMQKALAREVKAKDGTEMTVAEAMVLKQVELGLKGNQKAFEICRDTSGQSVTQKVEQVNIDADYMQSLDYIRALMENANK